MIDQFAQWASEDFEPYLRLSTGIDSTVWRIGDYVAKEYQRMSLAEVERYAALQNAAGEALRATPYEASIDLRGVATALSASQAIPVEWVGRSRNGKPLTFSRYIAATNLEKLLWKPPMFEAYAAAELHDSDLLAFAGDLNAYFWNEYPTRVQDELHYHTCMLSRRLDADLGVSGLYISKYNIKLQPVRHDRIDLIVTDLALYIERVVDTHRARDRVTCDG